jgi:alpha-tubulin suppressor-like RCC1 family protein
LGNGVTIVAAGATHTCALMQADRLNCWGDSSSGQLGDGNFTLFSSLAAVPDLGNVTAVSGGYVHTCALTATSSVHCWGDNAYGQLGDGSRTISARPVTVAELKASAVAAGNGYTCAITESANVACWGYNGFGQLGHRRRPDSNTPVFIEGLSSDVSAIAVNGTHVCALLTTGNVQCWGDNSSGQLGDGNGGEGIYSNSPVTVSGLSGVTAITGGYAHSCALTGAGGVLCWGDGESGQLGDGSSGAGVYATTPIQVSGLSSGIHAIAAGGYHTCALTSAGGVLCWGDNTHGQLGDGSNTSRVTPTPVSGLSSGVIAIVADYLHSCALTQSGSVLCWGDNDVFQLGLGEVDEPMRNTPSIAQGLESGIVAIGAGGLHTCAVTQAGEVQCWGANLYGELGTRAPWMPVHVHLQ